MTTITTITPQRLSELNESGDAFLLDVRTPVEFREVHAVGAKNIPLDALDVESVVQQRNGSASDTLYVICRSGKRASQACEKFVDAGYTNVVNVEGGTQAWDAAGLPVVRGQKSVSLERQVRIAAGLLVLAGIGLSFLHPYWIGLSAFVGAGLVFAGITDTCGMGMMLAKMPWNQVKDCGTECSAK